MFKDSVHDLDLGKWKVLHWLFNQILLFKCHKKSTLCDYETSKSIYRGIKAFLETSFWGYCKDTEHHLTCSVGFSQQSGSLSMISFWSCNTETHSLYSLQFVQSLHIQWHGDTAGSNMNLPFPAEQTDPHTCPSAHSRRPLTTLLLPGPWDSPQPENNPN